MNRSLQEEQTKRFEYLKLDEMEGFQKLKAALFSALILGLLRSGYKYNLGIVSPDAQVGCYLMQEQEDGSK